MQTYDAIHFTAVSRQVGLHWTLIHLANVRAVTRTALPSSRPL